MSNFQESGINFKFQSPKWNVVKYDEHLAHKSKQCLAAYQSGGLFRYS